MVAAIIRALGIRTCTHTRVYTVFFVMSRESCNCGFHSDNNFLRETVRAPLWRFFELGSMKNTFLRKSIIASSTIMRLSCLKVLYA